MKRFHVHVGVEDLEQSVRFYSSLFGAEPAVRKEDYAKWMVDDPRVNFAISQRSSGRVGVNHLGLQAESPDELAAIRTGFVAADQSSVVDEPNAHCCYAISDKHWVTDPQGVPWEAFHTLDSIPLFNPATDRDTSTRRCCAPSTDPMPDHEADKRAAPTACCS